MKSTQEDRNRFCSSSISFFKQANNEVNPDSIRFNFDTQKALIWNSKSGQNGMDVFAALTKNRMILCIS